MQLQDYEIIIFPDVISVYINFTSNLNFNQMFFFGLK